MKLILGLLLVATLTGCAVTGEGQFTGRVVDVAWEGILFKSCEMHLQFGEQSSKTSPASSVDKALCDRMQSLMGKVVTVKYDSWAGLCCARTNSTFIVKEVRE